MKNIILVLLLFTTLFVNGQNTYPIKEHYDKIYNVNGNPFRQYNDFNLTGNQLSWVLSSLLEMYETTGDKAYLIKFINHTIHIQNNRLDKLYPFWPYSNIKQWCSDTDHKNYMNRLLLDPMAKFVYMVINNQDLYNTNLPLSIIDDEAMDQVGSITILGYGDFANWLGYHIEETIIYHNQKFWINGVEGVKKWTGETLPSDMNLQMPYASALLYMGLTYTNFGFGYNGPYYLEKAQNIAARMKGNIVIGGNPSYNYPIIRHNTTYDSYFWFHRGWRIEGSNASDYISMYEDVSHGAMDLSFVYDCYKTQFAPTTLGTPYFTYTDMVRFKNTLTQRVYYSDISGGHFHNGVTGTDNQVAENNIPVDYYWAEVLDWMPLNQFDDASLPKAYDILMNHAIGLIQPSSSYYNLGGGQSVRGLSKVINAQWNKECVNLTLYNRNLIYSQDFNVKNKIVIAPAQADFFNNLGSSAFADPYYFTDDKFIIENNVTSHITAGESITLLPGFEAKTGSNVFMSIATTSCTDGLRIANTNNEEQEDLQDFIESTSHSVVNIYPNPNTGQFNVAVEGIEDKLLIEVYDVMGKQVFAENVTTTNKLIDISEQPRGIYLVKVTANNQVFTEKIIYQ